MAVWNRLYSWIVNKLRFVRYAFSARVKLYQFGSLYFGPYSNWKHDRRPLIFCMYSGPKYTHGLNTHYMNYSDKMWFGRLIYTIVKGKQVMDGFILYKLLKQQRMNIIRTCYRMYFTGMCSYKLVGQGLNTHLYKMLYPHTDRWLQTLNENTAPEEIAFPPIEIAYSPEELRNRIIEAQNAVPITKQRVSKTGAFGAAPWKL